MFFMFNYLFGQDIPFEPKKIEQILGFKGSMIAKEGVYKITVPRTDVSVSIDERVLDPFMGLASWVSFKSSDDSLMAMGDLLLFQDEVNPVMKTLLTNGFAVTALHNHFFFDQPKVYFMHIAGIGSDESLAKGLKQAINQIQTIRKKNPTPSDKKFLGRSIASKSSIDQKMIQSIFGVDAQGQDGMVKIVIGRSVQMDGVAITQNMGANSWASFAGSADWAMVDGDLAVFEDELQNVLKTFQNANINVVSIHNHMNHEEPRLLFVHFYGKGPAKELARGVKTAIDQLRD